MIPDMRNRVAEVAVPLMSEDELVEIIHKGESILNMDFGNVERKIASYSSGLAAICHQLCLNVCFAADIYETCHKPVAVSDEQFRAALVRYIKDASDTLKEVFDVALRRHRSRRFDNTRLILRALAHLGSSGGTHAEIFKEVVREEPSYPASNATNYLRELQSTDRGSILRFDNASGKYYFSDPLYLAFAQCLFQPKRADMKIKLKILGVSLSFEQGLQEFIEQQGPIRQGRKTSWKVISQEGVSSPLPSGKPRTPTAD